jgi:hypothetical protein
VKIERRLKPKGQDPMQMKTLAFTVLSALTLLTEVASAAGTRHSNWHWRGTTRNDEQMRIAAFQQVCVFGPGPSNHRLIVYSVERTDSRKPPFKPREFEAWGYAQCVWDEPAAPAPTPPQGPEMPNLAGNSGSSGGWDGGSDEDDSDQLGGHW